MLSCAFMAVSSLKSHRWTEDWCGCHLVCFSAFNVCNDYSSGDSMWGEYFKPDAWSRSPRSRLVYWQSSSSSFIHIPVLPDGRCSASIGTGAGGVGELTQWVRGGLHIIRHQPNSVVRSAINQNGLMRRWPCNHCPAREPSLGDREGILGWDSGNTAY